MADEATAATYLFEHEMKLKNSLFHLVSIHFSAGRKAGRMCCVSHWEFCLNGVKSVAGAGWLVVPWWPAWRPLHPTMSWSEAVRRAETYLVKTALETSLLLCTIIPLPVYDAKGNVLVGRTGNEADQARVLLSGGCKRLAPLPAMLSDDLERGRLGLVNKIRVKDVEPVPLNDLGRRVVMVVVCLVVLVPLVPHLHAVEVARLSWSILVGPERCRSTGDGLFGGKDLLVFADTACHLPIVEGLGGVGEVFVAR